MASGTTATNDVRLVPFYRNHFQRYAIYWRRFSSEEFQAENDRLARLARQKLELDARTLDRVIIGDAASEAAHGFESVRSFDGVARYDEEATHWRDARDGGWFSYDVKVTGDEPVTLRCTYWGQESGARTFDVLLDGKTIATTSLGDTGRAEYRNIDLPLKPEWVRGKKSIHLKFQAHAGNTAGGIFDLRILKSQP
jgi:hypothetical protein